MSVHVPAPIDLVVKKRKPSLDDEEEVSLLPLDSELEAKDIVDKSIIPNAVSAVPPSLRRFILDQLIEKVPNWRTLDNPDTDIEIEELCGGLTNKLYKASLPQRVTQLRKDLEFRTVVIRFFGKDTDLFFERESERIVTQTLSDNRQGVRVFGSFHEHGGGRLEAFYHGRTLCMEDLHNPEISLKIASSMANLHTLDIPLGRNPRLLLNLQKWFATAVSLNVEHVRSDRSKHIFTFQKLREEIDWFTKQLPRLQSPIVFCHNDLQEGNVIYDEELKKVQVIDFEYSAYNFRGADLANHFCEHYINYQVKSPPFFSIDIARYPSKDHQRRFLREYLRAYTAQRKLQQEHSSRFDDVLSDGHDWMDAEISDEDVEKLLQEVHWFMLGSHLQWGLWSIIQYVKSDIAFGYMEYAHARLSEYLREKEILVKEHLAQQLLQARSRASPTSSS